MSPHEKNRYEKYIDKATEAVSRANMLARKDSTGDAADLKPKLSKVVVALAEIEDVLASITPSEEDADSDE